MRNWTLAMGMVFSFAGLSQAGMKDPAVAVDGALPAKAEVRSVPSVEHQQTRSDRQDRGGRQEMHSSSSSKGGSMTSRERVRH